MISLTDEQKALFYTGGNFKDYVFYFPDIDLTITNETIHQEAVTIKESICEDDEFMLGGCVASSIEFEVSEIITQDISGLEFRAELYVNLQDDGTYDLKLPMGVYRVDSAKMVDDKDYKKVVAYDALYEASVDASDWYNALLPDEDSTVSLKRMRESLLIYLEIPFVSQTLPNDDMVVERTVRPELGSLPATMVLKAICALCGGFGRINREGKFEIIHACFLGLFPEETLYPSEKLYPQDALILGMSEVDTDYPEYRKTVYEEYMTTPITCLNIRTDEEDSGVTIGEDLTNPYLLIGNFLLYGKSISDLKKIGEKIFAYIEGVYYRPNTTELDGLPYIEAGDSYVLQKRNDTIESFVLSRTLSGVQGLKDTFEAKGEEIRGNEVSKNTKIEQLKGRTLKIEQTIDKVSTELADIEKGTNSKFEQTNEAIKAEVTRATQAEGTLTTKVTQTAEKIASEITRATQAEGNLSTKIEQTASGITTTVSQTYETKANAQATKTQLSSSITQLSNQISLKVTADDVESLIEQNASSIRLKASKISWSSTYSSMSESGILKCTSAEIKGTIKAGNDNDFWISLDKYGQLTGGYGYEQRGFLNFSASFSDEDGSTKTGVRIDGQAIALFTDMLAVAEKSAGTAWKTKTREFRIVSTIRYDDSYPNGIYYDYATLAFVNGLLVGIG